MNFSFENQGTYTYLVYAVDSNDDIDTMSLGMITNNKIPGLAPTVFTQMDSTKYIKFNVSAKISVKQFFDGVVNKKRLIGVFNGIIDAMLSAEDYMIDTNSIIMDLDYIFADVSTCETVLICLPINSLENKITDLGTFFKNIMFSTQFDQTENCDHVAKIMNYLNSTPVFSLVDFKKVLENIGEQSSSATVPTMSRVSSGQTSANVKSVPQQVKQETVQPPVAKQVKPVVNAVPQQQKKVEVPQSTPKQVPVVPPASTSTTEKKISAFGLLMHYSKENAELYKKQKAEKKGNTSSTVAQTNPGFSVPGQSNQSKGFAVPGTSTGNQGFAIPGQPVNAPTKTPSTNQPTTTVQPPVSTQPKQQVYQPPKQPQGQSGSFGETTVLGGGNIGETTVLNATTNIARNTTPHLIRLKNNENIPLNKPVFRIGKERSYVDYFIGDNTAISRSHANIISRDGEYFIVDTNSTNHTFVNGSMIQSNDEVKINDGDKIRLANEDFDFKLY